MNKFAMVGYYLSGAAYAIGGSGVTLDEAKAHAAQESIESFQLFPVSGGQHGFYRRDENGEYKQGRSREFAAQLSPYVAKLIEKDEAEK